MLRVMLIAQRNAMMDKAQDLWLWLAILGGCVIVLILAIALVRRWVLASSDSNDQPAFTLDDLRRLRQSGDLNEEEYERARRQLLGALGAGVASDHVMASPPESADSSSNDATADDTDPEGDPAAPDGVDEDGDNGGDEDRDRV